MTSIALTSSGPLFLRETTRVRRANWPRALFWAVALSGFFVLVYGACNALTDHRAIAGERIG